MLKNVTKIVSFTEVIYCIVNTFINYYYQVL